ncbi:hypothetical protein BG011_007870 [Mortierella polycephala]|uniref:Uncharacterized protein n=1 Tax=Mortierella polycephala TaxID=41804 RepID=A0A9P6TXN2_9FUNG|nr:hypothetical protein BG011_007870 [Mortierella polycephala]
MLGATVANANCALNASCPMGRRPPSVIEDLIYSVGAGNQGGELIIDGQDRVWYYDDVSQLQCPSGIYLLGYDCPLHRCVLKAQGDTDQRDLGAQQQDEDPKSDL